MTNKMSNKKLPLFCFLTQTFTSVLPVTSFDYMYRNEQRKRLLKLLQRVKIIYSFSQFVSNLFQIYHFKLAYVVLHMAVKNFSKPTSKNGEISRFNRSLLKESF